MQIQTRVQDAIAIVVLSGRLTVNDSPGQLKDAVADVVRRGAKQVILDMAGVNYIDSTRLGELIAAHIAVSRIGTHLKLAGTPTRVIELLTLAGLGEVFERFPSVDAAIASLDAGLRDRD
ncbi:MAG: STAS domain-containing protein [Acidobacteriota bacterium]